jgi:alpha-mannosidase
LALLPHGRGLESVLEEAEALNRPPRVIAGGSASKPAGPPFVTVLDGTVEVVALKGADDGSGDIVVRLHEPLGDRGRVRLGFAGGVQRVARCSLLEDPGDELVVDATAVELELRPFELVTLRVSLASRS